MQLLYKNQLICNIISRQKCLSHRWSFAFKLQGYVVMYYTSEIRAFKNKLVPILY